MAKYVCYPNVFRNRLAGSLSTNRMNERQTGQTVSAKDGTTHTVCGENCLVDSSGHYGIQAEVAAAHAGQPSARGPLLAEINHTNPSRKKLQLDLVRMYVMREINHVPESRRADGCLGAVFVVVIGLGWAAGASCSGGRSR